MNVDFLVCLCTVVNFGHRSAFPVMFDAESVEKWWKSSLVFKVYCKFPAQKMVSYMFCMLTYVAFVKISLFIFL